MFVSNSEEHVIPSHEMHLNQTGRCIFLLAQWLKQLIDYQKCCGLIFWNQLNSINNSEVFSFMGGKKDTNNIDLPTEGLLSTSSSVMSKGLMSAHSSSLVAGSSLRLFSPKLVESSVSSLACWAKEQSLQHTNTVFITDSEQITHV